MSIDAIETFETRMAIARDVLAKLGTRRAAQGLQPSHPPESPKWGFEGVDRPHKGRPKYRARIRFCDAAAGKDVRISSTGYDDPADAGYWYMCAHIRAWGALSHFAAEVTPKMLTFLEKGAPTPIRDNLRGIKTERNAPPIEGWSGLPDGCVVEGNAPPVEGTDTKKNVSPVEGWYGIPDDCVV